METLVWECKEKVFMRFSPFFPHFRKLRELYYEFQNGVIERTNYNFSTSFLIENVLLWRNTFYIAFSRVDAGVLNDKTKSVIERYKVKVIKVFFFHWNATISTIEETLPRCSYGKEFILIKCGKPFNCYFHVGLLLPFLRNQMWTQNVPYSEHQFNQCVDNERFLCRFCREIAGTLLGNTRINSVVVINSNVNCNCSSDEVKTQTLRQGEVCK